MVCKWYAALNHAPWVANLAQFQAVFVHNFGLEWLLETTVVVRLSIATVWAATQQLFRLAAASASSMAKWSESSVLLYTTSHPVGGAFPLNLICISLKFLHTPLWETPIHLSALPEGCPFVDFLLEYLIKFYLYNIIQTYLLYILGSMPQGTHTFTMLCLAIYLC